MSDFSQTDKIYMTRALELAGRALGRTSPNPMVGAVLVREDRIIGEGFHHAAGLPHAEVEAINGASGDVRGATLYVSLEPCCHHGRTPPCADLIVERGIARVVVAVMDPNPQVSGKGAERLRKAGIAVDFGLYEAEAQQLNETFFTYHTLKRPFVICKWAMTLDGRIATDSGQSQWITNERSRMFVHERRSQVDAIMVGIGTILMDDPMLTVRTPGFDWRQPRRIILDSKLRIPLRARCLASSPPGQCVIATTDESSSDKIAKLRHDGHDVIVLPGNRRFLDLKDLIHALAEREIQSVLCEGGSSLHGSLFKSRLVDKVIAFVAPKIIGGTVAKAPISGWGINHMSNAVSLSRVSFHQFEEDLCVEGYVRHAGNDDEGEELNAEESELQ